MSPCQEVKLARGKGMDGRRRGGRAFNYGSAFFQGGGGGMKMSSYALTMIIITFLQQLERPLLHSVHELQSVPGIVSDGLTFIQ